jgi:hypothetical protein
MEIIPQGRLRIPKARQRAEKRWFEVEAGSFIPGIADPRPVHGTAPKTHMPTSVFDLYLSLKRSRRPEDCSLSE